MRRGSDFSALTPTIKSLARNDKYMRKQPGICGLPTTSSDRQVRQGFGRKMSGLSIDVRHHDIIVSQPETGHCVTYRRDPNSPMLEALCEIRGDPDAETLQFLTEAWKAAYAKAKALGWL